MNMEQMMVCPKWEICGADCPDKNPHPLDVYCSSSRCDHIGTDSCFDVVGACREYDKWKSKEIPKSNKPVEAHHTIEKVAGEVQLTKPMRESKPERKPEFWRIAGMDDHYTSEESARGKAELLTIEDPMHRPVKIFAAYHVATVAAKVEWSEVK